MPGKQAEDPAAPAWLSSENDEQIREETAPLFGTGTLSLQDAIVPTDRTVATKASSKVSNKKNSTANYGSALKSPAMNADKDDGDDEEKVILVETAPSKFVKTAMVDPETLKPHVPGQNACLWLFHLLEGVSITAALCLMITQILPVVLVRPKDIAARIGVTSMALRVYIAIFCILFVCTETQAPVPVVRNSQLLQTYISRGFLYSFLGLICVEEAYSERVKGIVSHVDDSFHIAWASVFMEVSSWLMLATGALYTLLGVFCCKRVRDRMKQKEKDAWKRYKEELAAWKQRFE